MNTTTPFAAVEGVSVRAGLRPTIFMYDLHGRRARSWLLFGPAGVAELKAASLPWLPSEAVIDGENWKALALGLHTSRPLYDGQAPNRDCSLKHTTCYFTVSDTSASHLLRTSADTGDDAILWTALEHEYARTEQLTPIEWRCRACDAAMASATVPDDPICPACTRAGRINELTARRTRLVNMLDAVDTELTRIGGIEGTAA